MTKALEKYEEAVLKASPFSPYDRIDYTIYLHFLWVFQSSRMEVLIVPVKSSFHPKIKR